MAKGGQRFLLTMALALPAAAAAHAPGADRLSSAPDGYAWHALATGAGGWITGIDVHRAGRAIYARADTGGAFRLDRNRRPLRWEQIVTAATMPETAMEPFFYPGVTAIKSAPSNALRVYMVWPDARGHGHLYRSDDGGHHWRMTVLDLPDEADGPNGPGRHQGERIAVDPANPDRLYYGSLGSGLWASRDGGSQWRAVADVPSSGEQTFGVGNVVTDPRVTRGRSRGIAYASVYRRGIFATRDGGLHWRALSGGSGPAPGAVVQHLAVSSDGRLLAAADGALFVRESGRWRRAATPGGLEVAALAVDPHRPGRVVVTDGFGHSATSDDWGRHFSAPQTPQRRAADIPWHTWVDEAFSTATIAFDPAVPGRLWAAEGIGVWWAQDQGSGPLRWHGLSAGIEQLVSNAIAAPPGGPVITASWDRALFRHRNPDAYPHESGPTRRFNSGWDIVYSRDDPRVLVAIVSDHRMCCDRPDSPDNQSGTSRNGGRSWAPFPAIADGSLPKALRFGTIAMARHDAGNLVWVPTNDGPVHFTLDGGAHWQPARFADAGGAALPAPGAHAAFYLDRHSVAADPVQDRRFYLLASDGRVLGSHDGGQSWTRAGALPDAARFGRDATLRAVPGFEGFLCASAGGAAPLMCSRDGGATWAPMARTGNVTNFAFGAPRLPGGPATVFLQGRIDGDPGIWCSADLGAHWGRLALYPLGMSAPLRAIEADPQVFGRVYLGIAGNGFVYGSPRGRAAATLCASPAR